MSWGASYECWLLSTMLKGESHSLIIEETPGEFDWAISEKASFITKWGVFKYSDLNPKYFKFSQTNSYTKE
jgi:hypothetical protein